MARPVLGLVGSGRSDTAAQVTDRLDRGLLDRGLLGRGLLGRAVLGRDRQAASRRNRVAGILPAAADSL